MLRRKGSYSQSNTTPPAHHSPGPQCGAIGFTPLDFILPLLLYSKVRRVP